MKILFDHATPAPLRHHLQGDEVDTAASMGWDRLSNGDLLNAAEENGYDVLITTDQNIRYQQNMRNRSIRVITLMVGRWPQIRNHTDLVNQALEQAQPGTVTEIYFPDNFTETDAP